MTALSDVCSGASMNISAVKTTQFTPLVLYAPADKHIINAPNTKSKFETNRIREDVEMRKIFTRLSESRMVSTLLERAKHCTKGPRSFGIVPKIEFPSEEGMQCMCYGKFMQMIRDQAFLRAPLKFYKLIKPIPNKDVKPTWQQRAMRSYQENEHLQFPLSTVIVRWKLLRIGPKYNIPIIHKMLNYYGELKSIKILSHNSCIAIFQNVADACSAVQSQHIGYPNSKLHLTWWHSTMANKSVTARPSHQRGISVITDPLKPIKSGV